MEVIKVPVKKENEKIRVAVYCRVSTKLEEQEDSLEIQAKYYTSLIRTRPDWVLAGIYADTKSGLSAGKRPQFMQMIRDALDGKIDRILCKSVSRFSRNAAECRKYTDMLRMKNVVVEFEKENIRTDDPTSSLIFSLMSAVADSESKSTSDNIKWAVSQRYKRGEFNLGNNRILGYDTVDGKLVPNGDAWIVRKIFTDFANGKTPSEIKRELLGMNIQTTTGKHYSFDNIKYILGNETYRGDKKLWKTPARDLYTKKTDPTQKRESIYLKDDHEAIVDDVTWLMVQERLRGYEDLKRITGHIGGNMKFLYGKLFCGKCGEPLRSKKYSYKKEHGSAWTCRRRCQKGCLCKLDIVMEEDLCKMIASQMKWECYDEKRFSAEISRVVVHSKKKITIVKK